VAGEAEALSAGGMGERFRGRGAASGDGVTVASGVGDGITSMGVGVACCGEGASAC